MSYCRWSSDDFGCDLYCYQSDAAYVTHVAASRYDGPIPKITADLSDTDAFVAQLIAQLAACDPDRMTAIGLPFDGQSFYDPTLAEFLERVKMLRAAGYRVPDRVLEEIEEELADEATA